MQVSKLYKQLLKNKKVRYILISLIITAVLFYLSSLLTNDRELFYAVLVFGVMGIVVLTGTQFSEIIKTSWVLSLVLPLHLSIGFLITFFYFPHLGPVIRILAFFGLFITNYLLLLINNIFLVVEEKGSTIPLYNAAVTWVQILITTISIPLVSGVYKIPVNFLVQNMIVLFSVIILSAYFVWVLTYDEDIIRTTLREKINLLALLSFLVFLGGISISFFPSESFLRGLLIASMIMFNLNYIYGHYKNRLSARVLYEYGIIVVIFLILLITFRP